MHRRRQPFVCPEQKAAGGVPQVHPSYLEHFARLFDPGVTQEPVNWRHLYEKHPVGTPETEEETFLDLPFPHREGEGAYLMSRLRTRTLHIQWEKTLADLQQMFQDENNFFTIKLGYEDLQKLFSRCVEPDCQHEMVILAIELSSMRVMPYALSQPLRCQLYGGGLDVRGGDTVCQPRIGFYHSFQPDTLSLEGLLIHHQPNRTYQPLEMLLFDALGHAESERTFTFQDLVWLDQFRYYHEHLQVTPGLSTEVTIPVKDNHQELSLLAHHMLQRLPQIYTTESDRLKQVHLSHMTRKRKNNETEEEEEHLVLQDSEVTTTMNELYLSLQNKLGYFKPLSSRVTHSGEKTGFRLEFSPADTGLFLSDLFRLLEKHHTSTRVSVQLVFNFVVLVL